MLKIKYNGNDFSLNISEVRKWSDFDIPFALKKSQRNELKRRILKSIKLDRDLVVELLGVEDVDKELDLLPVIDYSNTGMKKSHSPFKVL